MLTLLLFISIGVGASHGIVKIVMRHRYNPYYYSFEGNSKSKPIE